MNEKNNDALTKARPQSLAKTLARITDRIEQQKREKTAQLKAEGFSAEIIDEVAEEHEQLIKATSEAKQQIASRGGQGAMRIIEQAQLNLLELEQRGDFKQHPIQPGHEYPTLLTRVPIFLSVQRATAKKLLDKDLALPFNTGWGTGRKFGPFLSTYDEDTLLALLALRQRQLNGMGSRMPVKVIDPFDPTKETEVHMLYTTIGEIEEYLKIKKGGRGYKKRLDSVKRIAAVTIELTKTSDPLIKPLIKARTFNTKIIDLVSEEMSTDSVLYIQFPPAMVKWLKEHYTFIDMDIRRQLRGDHAKCIHKFLSGQPQFNIGAKKLRDDLVMSRAPMYKFMEVLRGAMEQLATLGWCEYEITGTGRKTPFILKGHRLKKARK